MFKLFRNDSLADPSRVSGLILRKINQNPGITPSALGKDLHKTPSHISNELKELYKEGLLEKLTRGRITCLYLSGIGKDVLNSFTAMRSLPKGTNAMHPQRNYPYSDPNRTKNPSTKLPGLRSFFKEVA